MLFSPCLSIVIPDKLLVSATSPSLATTTFRSQAATAIDPPQVALSESQELQLLCTVASETQQHTHLSVSFGVSTPEAIIESRMVPQEVIGVRRDFAVEAGRQYAERHRARELSVAKVGDRQYQMALGWLRPEDSGTYHCTAGEWIRDPDGTWQQIVEKRVALAQVVVRPIGETYSPDSFWALGGGKLSTSNLCHDSNLALSPYFHFPRFSFQPRNWPYLQVRP